MSGEEQTHPVTERLLQSLTELTVEIRGLVEKTGRIESRLEDDKRLQRDVDKAVDRITELEKAAAAERTENAKQITRLETRFGAAIGVVAVLVPAVLKLLHIL